MIFIVYLTPRLRGSKASVDYGKEPFLAQCRRLPIVIWLGFVPAESYLIHTLAEKVKNEEGKAGARAYSATLGSCCMRQFDMIVCVDWGWAKSGPSL